MITHNAPPVVYPIGRSRSQGLALLAFWFAGLFGVAFWAHHAGGVDWRILWALVAVLLAGAAAFAGWRNSPVGQLAWDGQSWRWESPGYQTGVAEQTLSVVADFQNLLMLRLENQARARLWLWTERSAFPARWMDLRRAVYSPLRAAPADAGKTNA